MFCGKCGVEIQEGLGICPKCGKSPKGVDSNSSNFPLISLSAKLYTVFFEISLWILLIIGPIVGGIIGNLVDRGDGIFPGIIIGFILGFVLMILFGGLTSIFLKIKENTDRIKYS